MKTTVFILSVIAAALPSMASTCPSTASPNCTPTPTCTPSMSDDKVQACGQEWLNIDTVTLEAANGNPLAQYTIAYLTDTGTPTTKANPDMAKKMYSHALPKLTAAADSGHVGACRALSQIYAQGRGVEKNPEMAAKYAQMAKECAAKPCAAPVKECTDKPCDAPAKPCANTPTK